jgi:hypothetical protein
MDAFKPGKGQTMKFRTVSPAIAFLLFAGLLAAADPQLISLLMPDAKVVAGLNVEQAKNSPFGQFLLARAQAGNDGLAKLTTLTGFDPRRDLQEVLVGTVGEPGQKGLVLARGTFDSARIFAAAQLGGHTVETYKGVNILTGNEDSMTHAVAFLDDSIAVAGDLDSVHGAIDRRTSGNSLDPTLAAKVDQLSSSLDAWSVSTVPFAALANQKVPNVNLSQMLNSNVLKSILQTSGGVKFGAIIRLSGEAVARSAQDATALANVAQFLGNMVQANAPAASAAAITALVQSISVQADGNTVKFALAVPEAQVENFVSTAQQHKSAHAAPSKL